MSCPISWIPPDIMRCALLPTLRMRLEGSFAGQFKTILDVQGEQAILMAILSSGPV